MRGRNTVLKSALTALITLVCVAASGIGSADTVKDWLSSHHEGVFHTADLDACHLEHGGIIHDCQLTFRTYGRLATDFSNIVLMPTWLNGNAEGLASAHYLGPDGIVDTDDYFVIAVNALGNGVSSSPSNNAQAPFPHFTIRDQVSLQYRLVTELLGIERLHAVVGASMGAYQTYEWLMMYPQFAKYFVPIEGTPWYTFYDRLKGRAWQEVLTLPNDSPEAIRRKATLLATIDGMIFWTPEYLNREQSLEHFDAWLDGMARFDNEAALLDRASQNSSTAEHDIRRDRPDYADQLKALPRSKVLAIVFERDMTVNPEPNKLLAQEVGFDVVEIPGDCGHFGPNPECYQEQVVERVADFLGAPPEKVLQRRTVQIDGDARSFFVYLPDAYGSRPLPVVLALHGYGSTATGFASAHALNQHANANDYIIAYPQGARFYTEPAWQKDETLVSSWNDLASNYSCRGGTSHCLPDRLAYPCYASCGECKACDWTSCEDDVGFLLGIVDNLQQTLMTDLESFLFARQQQWWKHGTATRV